jgi:hypothetical protein
MWWWWVAPTGYILMSASATRPHPLRVFGALGRYKYLLRAPHRGSCADQLTDEQHAHRQAGIQGTAAAQGHRDRTVM